jgi:hypothetical protein
MNRHDDRCDRCGAEALVSYVFKDRNILIFCGHHARELNDAIYDAGGVLLIETPE